VGICRKCGNAFGEKMLVTGEDGGTVCRVCAAEKGVLQEKRKEDVGKSSLAWLLRGPLNGAQKTVLVAGAIVVFLMGLFPPAVYEGHLRYNLIFEASGKVDLARLILQWILVGMLASGLVWLLGRPRFRSGGVFSRIRKFLRSPIGLAVLGGLVLLPLAFFGVAGTVAYMRGPEDASGKQPSEPPPPPNTLKRLGRELVASGKIPATTKVERKRDTKNPWAARAEELRAAGELPTTRGKGDVIDRTLAELKSETRAKWRQLRKGMTQDKVRALLGEPGKVTVVSSSYTQWRYGSLLHGGNVSFGEKGVDGWSEPDWDHFR